MVIDDNTRIINFAYTPELKKTYTQLIALDTDFYKDFRKFELLIAQAVSTHDYQRIKPLLTMALSHIRPINFNNRVIVYYTVALITLLTRTAIVDGVSEKDAYALSDTYLTLNFQNLSIEPLKLIYEIAENFMKLIENTKHYQYDSTLVSQVTKFIHNNITSKFTLYTLSDYFDVTPEHLSSHFKIVTGMSLKEFINQEKVNHAKYLLVSTNNSILQITLELGYADQSYFSKIFKQYTKKTPARFRREGIAKIKAQTHQERVSTK